MCKISRKLISIYFIVRTILLLVTFIVKQCNTAHPTTPTHTNKCSTIVSNNINGLLVFAWRKASQRYLQQIKKESGIAILPCKGFLSLFSLIHPHDESTKILGGPQVFSLAHMY